MTRVTSAWSIYRVIKNIAHLCGRSRSNTWGPEGWKKVVVCIVSDGRSKVNKRTLQVLTLVSLLVFGLILLCLYTVPRWGVIRKVSRKTQWPGRMWLLTFLSELKSSRILYIMIKCAADILQMLSLQTQERCLLASALFRSSSVWRNRTRRN